jgi:TPP-dependent pyruvate/acetoin dehydrogenase alpha subunit
MAIVTEPTMTRADLERAYEQMLAIRLFEGVSHRLFLNNEIEGAIHLYEGEEACAVGVCGALDPGDTVACTYRGHGVLLAMGTAPEALFAEMLGRSTGVCGGRAGSMNVVDLEHGVIGCYGIVGGSIGAGTGAALAAQLLEDDSVAVAFFGDGTVNQGYFHECLNLAGVRRLPLVLACENNQYGEFTAYESVTAGGAIAERAAAYGFPGEEVDGNDIAAVRAAAERAVDRARMGRGPTLLELHTYRHKGHSRHDNPNRYRPAGELEEWLERDPLKVAGARLEEAWLAETQTRVEREIDAALEAAKAAPLPDPHDGFTAERAV